MSTEEVNTNKDAPTEEHVHGENCNHEHEDEKGAKSEKKVRKALGKLGMTKLENVNRVTVRQKDNYILVVKDPEVYTSQQSENTMIIFGELTFDDPDKAHAKEELAKMKPEGEMIKPEVTSEKKETVEIVDENEQVSEEGMDPAQIETVMVEGNCSRQRAVKALKANNNDVVVSILSCLS